MGVLLQNETKYDGMISILDHVHQYVPTVRFPSIKEVPQSNESEHVEAVHMNRLPFGGDQIPLTMHNDYKGLLLLLRTGTQNCAC